MLAAVLAGCGGGGSKKQASAPAQSAPAATVTTVAPARTTTTEQATTTQRAAPRHVSSSSAPLRVAAPYTCEGKPLRAIAADGPVKVQPAIVKPGQSFTVTVTEPGARVADITLAGVAPQPILVKGALRSGALEAKIRMPTYATCGNKLLEIEGDISAEAYVGVGAN